MLQQDLQWLTMIARYIYWRDGDHWLGYFEEYPDYQTQGKSFEDLQEPLKDLYRDLAISSAARFKAFGQPPGS